jgi:LysR family hydrogen peroxide-inducible transcriptional activator
LGGDEMNTDLYRYVLAIAKEGNVNRASKSLYISQPALLKALRNAESLYGAKLFYRSGRNLILTEEGALFIEYGTKILDLENELKQKLGNNSTTVKSSITLAVSGERGASTIPLLLPQFEKVCHNCELKVLEGTTPKLTQDLMDKSADLAVLSLPIRNEKIAYKIVADSYVFIACSRNSPFARNFDLRYNSLYTPYLITREMLKDAHFILGEKELGIRNIADEIFTKLHLKPKIDQEFSRHQTIAKILLASDQLGIIPYTTASKLGLANKLCFFTTEDPPVNRYIVIAYRKGHHLTREEKILINLTEKILRLVVK